MGLPSCVRLETYQALRIDSRSNLITEKPSICKNRAARRRRLSTAIQTEALASGQKVTLLDYGAGNIRSIKNAIMKLGYEIHEV